MKTIGPDFGLILDMFILTRPQKKKKATAGDRWVFFMQYVSFFWWIHKIECHWHLYQLCWLELNKQMLLNISTLIYFIYIEYCIVHRRKTSSSLDKDCFGIESLLITDRISGSGDLMEGFTISPHNDPCDGALKLFN